MGDNTFAIFSSIFGFVVAAISLLAFLVNICLARLPRNRIKELESLIDETEAFFEKALEDGHLVEPGFVWKTERQLARLRKTTRHLQFRAYTSLTICEDCREFFRGTSWLIGDTCCSIKKLRAQLLTSTEKGSQLRDRNVVTRHSSSLPVPLIPRPKSSPLRSIQSARLHSCRPVLCVSRFGDVRRGFPQGNPLHNPTQSDSDVRITDALDSTSIIDTTVTREQGA